MTQVTRHFYRPIYEAFCSGCSMKMIYRIESKYPKGIDRMVCSSCKKEFNVKFFPNDNNIMTLELREIRN